MRALFTAGADINARGSTPVHRAILCDGGMDVLQFLIERGVDLTIRDWRGFTALHLVVYSINVDVTNMLLNANADSMALDVLGYTVLHIAAKATVGKFEHERSSDGSLKEILLEAAASGHWFNNKDK